MRPASSTSRRVGRSTSVPVAGRQPSRCRIACPLLSFVLVEARAKECAFLRAAVRELNLDGVEVENRRFEELSRRARIWPVRPTW